MKLNMMELIASIISYSMATWQIKVKLTFLVFDFDESKTLTKDEMVILIISFIRGISIMTRSRLYHSLDIDPVAKKCFDIADASPHGVITLEQLTNWVANTPQILKLFKSTETRKKLLPDYKFKGKLYKLDKFSKTGDEEPRRKSISLSFTGRKIEKPRPKPPKPDAFAINITELQNLFSSVSNSLGLAMLEDLYQVLSQSKKYSKDTDFLYHEFNFERKKKVTFNQFTEYIKKRRSKIGYSLEKEGDIVFPDCDNRYAMNQSQINENALKTMFSKFDINKDGVLTKDELTTGLKNFDQRSVEEMFYSYDHDKNNVLDYQEFTNLFSPGKDVKQPEKRKKDSIFNKWK